jgi:hypothetical protein
MKKKSFHERIKETDETSQILMKGNGKPCPLCEKLKKLLNEIGEIIPLEPHVMYDACKRYNFTDKEINWLEMDIYE